MISTFIKPGTVPYNHYSMLKSIFVYRRMGATS